MARKCVLAGVLLVLALVYASSSVAAGVPRATLAKKADAICTAANAKLLHFKSAPPNFDEPSNATVKQIKASAPWFTESLALVLDENQKIFALGTPNEPAARTAWNRWHTLVSTVAIPEIKAVIAASRTGDTKAFAGAFARADKPSREAQKLIRGLGIKVCEFGG